MKLSLFKKTQTNIDYSFFLDISKHRQQILKILKKSPGKPIFIVDTSIINNRLSQIKKSAKIAYSFKTNYDVAKNFLFPMAEAVSDFDLKIALKQKYQPKSIIINGPNKGNLHELLSHQYIINLNDFTEINCLLKYKKNIKASIGIRVNSDNHPSRFGFNIESGEANKAISILRDNHVRLSGIHFHIGGLIYDSKIYHDCSTILSKFLHKNIVNSPSLKYIDFGGGYPSHNIISGTNLQSLPNIDEYLKSIIVPLKSILNKNTTLILEPGRFLVDDSVSFICQILDIKATNDLQIITLNGTINMLPSAWYHHLIIKSYDQNLIEIKDDQSQIQTKMFGGTCQEDDVLYQGKTPHLHIGDYIVFSSIGAYNQSQSPDFIFKKPKTFFI